MEKLQKLAGYFRSVRSVVGISRFGSWLLFGTLIGLVAGLGAIVFRFSVDVVTDLLYGSLAGVRFPTESLAPGTEQLTGLESRHWLFFVLPALGGLAAGWLVYKFAPEAEGHGTDEVIRAFHHERGHIRRRVPVLKTITSALTIGSGGSAGREGPVAQIGAGFGSFLADLLKLPDKDRRLMVLAGVGGGVGSMFHAPLGGALFSTEVLYREPDFEYEGLIPAIISAIVAYSLYGVVYGWGAIFSTPEMAFDKPLHLLFYILFGILAAGTGILYVKVFYGMRDRVFRKLKIKRYFLPAIGGLVLGVLGYFFPPILGTGYGWIQLAIYGHVALWTMIVFPILKIIATSLTIGSGGSGGVFAPSLVIGGMLGGAFGTLCQILFPELDLQPAAFIIVGMAGFFAGIAKVPVSALIMVAEMTGSYGLLVPTMLVATIALVLGWRTSIYEMQVPHRAESPAHRGEFLMSILDKMKVRTSMVKTAPHQIVEENMLLRELIKVVTRTNLHYFFTVDRDQRLTGMIALDELRRVMLESHLGPILVAKDLAAPPPPVVRPEDSLSDALNRFVASALDELPVVRGDNGALTGIIRKKDLVVVYTHALAETQDAAG
jgi:CIC family chloride channel protein